MKRALFVAVVALVGANMVQAQPPGGGAKGGRGGPGGRGPLAILNLPSVQQELKLDDSQKQEIKDEAKKAADSSKGWQDLSREERTKKFQEMGAAQQKTVDKILKPDQAKRLKEITLQAQGARALADPKVATELGLNDEQKGKVKEIVDEVNQQMTELRSGGGTPEENRDKMDEIRRGASQRVQKVLTDEQKSKWQEMTGKPFKLEMPMGGGRGGR